MNIDPLAVAIGFGVLLLSLTIHEAAHALTADRLGDPTARALGRVSLNPLVHIDLLGTVVLPLLAIISHLPIIGWAKPVPVNTRNLRHPPKTYFEPTDLESKLIDPSRPHWEKHCPLRASGEKCLCATRAKQGGMPLEESSHPAAA